MFWSIPNNNEEIRINTPPGIKSLRGIFFETKGAVRKDIERISIQVGFREIVRDIPVVVFLDNKPPINWQDSVVDDINGYFLYDWKDICIELNLNVDNTEIVINCKNTTDDNYSIVFICDENSVQQENYTFFEVSKLPFAAGRYNIQTVFPPDRICLYGTIENRPSDPLSTYYNDIYSLTIRDLSKRQIMISDDINGNLFEFFYNIILITAFRKIPLRKAMYFFNKKIGKNIQVELKGNSVSAESQKYLYVILGYKKI